MQACNPVILVHGLTDTAAIFDRMAEQLTVLGWQTYGIDLIPANGDRGLEVLAQQLSDFIDRHCPHGQPLDLVGFSMGGLVSRYYVQCLGGLERVQRLITIASPHHGTWTGHLSGRPGCVQMRPNSRFLQNLNRTISCLAKIRSTSLWTPFDLMIVPADSSILPIGQNIQIPVPLHSWMVSDRQVIAAVVQALQAPAD